MNKLVISVVVLSVVCLGCGPGGPEIAGVEGTVTMDGQPLAEATVVFAPQNGRPAGAQTDAQGRYELNFSAGRKGAVLGKNRVMIMTAADPSETPDGQPIPAKPETIPARYNAQTELEFTVESGKINVADFELTSGGDLPASDSIVEDSLQD